MPLHCGEDIIDPARRVGSIAQDTSRILRDLLYPLPLSLVRHFVTQIYSSEPQEFQDTFIRAWAGARTVLLTPPKIGILRKP